MEAEVQKTKAQLLREKMQGCKESSDGVIRTLIDDCHLFPDILEVLVPRENGKNAKGGRIGIYVKGGKLQVVISWPEAGVYGFAAVTTFTGLAEAIQEQLKSEDIDWLEDRSAKRTGGSNGF